MRRLAVLRPEPGNAATCARIRAAGGIALALPLFTLRALDWDAPDPAQFDAVFLTSANAVRLGGSAVGHYCDLPAFAVGEATAAAARLAGFHVVAVGDTDARGLADLARRHEVSRALYLAGRHRTDANLPGVARAIEVYANEPCEMSASDLNSLIDSVALIHSPRAGARLATLVHDRAAVRIAAISDATLAAAGPGWAKTMVATEPNDAALIAAALALAD